MTRDVADGVLHVVCPQLRDRPDVRVVSALIADVPGVTMVEVDLRTRSVRVSGAVTLATLQQAVRIAGFALVSGTAESPPDRERATPAGDADGDYAGQPPA